MILTGLLLCSLLATRKDEAAERAGEDGVSFCIVLLMTYQLFRPLAAGYSESPIVFPGISWESQTRLLTLSKVKMPSCSI